MAKAESIEIVILPTLMSKAVTKLTHIIGQAGAMRPPASVVPPNRARRYVSSIWSPGTKDIGIACVICEVVWVEATIVT
jgi:hypothetical protein